MKPNMAIYMYLIITSFLLVSCGSGPEMVDDSATRTSADIFSNYRPSSEDEVFEFIGLADLTVEEIKALLSEPEPESVPGDEGKFSDRFPSLKVSHDKLNVEISSGSMSTKVLNIDREGNGDFEWDFMLVEQPEWLSAHRSLDLEEGDIHGQS